MTLMPPRPGTCGDCARAHDPAEPHDARSLHYQIKFRMGHGRDPDWRDAMAHCDEATRAEWTAALTAKGIDVAGGGT